MYLEHCLIRSPLFICSWWVTPLKEPHADSLLCVAFEAERRSRKSRRVNNRTFYGSDLNQLLRFFRHSSIVHAGSPSWITGALRENGAIHNVISNPRQHPPTHTPAQVKVSAAEKKRPVSHVLVRSSCAAHRAAATIQYLSEWCWRIFPRTAVGIFHSKTFWLVTVCEKASNANTKNDVPTMSQWDVAVKQPAHYLDHDTEAVKGKHAKTWTSRLFTPRFHFCIVTCRSDLKSTSNHGVLFLFPSAERAFAFQQVLPRMVSRFHLFIFFINKTI